MTAVRPAVPVGVGREHDTNGRRLPAATAFGGRKCALPGIAADAELPTTTASGHQEGEDSVLADSSAQPVQEPLMFGNADVAESGRRCLPTYR